MPTSLAPLLERANITYRMRHPKAADQGPRVRSSLPRPDILLCSLRYELDNFPPICLSHYLRRSKALMFVIVDTETERLVSPENWLVVCTEVETEKGPCLPEPS